LGTLLAQPMLLLVLSGSFSVHLFRLLGCAARFRPPYLAKPTRSCRPEKHTERADFLARCGQMSQRNLSVEVVQEVCPVGEWWCVGHGNIIVPTGFDICALWRRHYGAIARTIALLRLAL
jgi:hypothetical protein